ncbi:MAG: GpE family phage tail protein [Myxococcaceae bacterium]|nr:GpE family phage tail protein [Myxococcaceae bacterium]
MWAPRKGCSKEAPVALSDRLFELAADCAFAFGWPPDVALGLTIPELLRWHAQALRLCGRS